MTKKEKDNPWEPYRHTVGKYERDRKKRMYMIAAYLVSKEYSRKMKGKFRTLQMGVETENLLRERVRSFELKLRREVLLYDEVRRGKSRTSSLRRRFVFWRLFYQHKLTIHMISWLLNVNPTTVKSNIGSAYHKLS
jgi:hypothetical protein